jgi:hypothetical protein
MVYISVGFGLGKVIEPIPLSPEILEKAGFRLDVYRYMHPLTNTILVLKHNMLVQSMGTGYDDIPEDIPHIKYLHQLQNLIFALCGEELNITL